MKSDSRGHLNSFPLGLTQVGSLMRWATGTALGAQSPAWGLGGGAGICYLTLGHGWKRFFSHGVSSLFKNLCPLMSCTRNGFIQVPWFDQELLILLFQVKYKVCILCKHVFLVGRFLSINLILIRTSVILFTVCSVYRKNWHKYSVLRVRKLCIYYKYI